MNRKKSLTTSIIDFFSSQLGLFILGALITSLLVPWFFQVWQDYQKELEIKTELVGRISEAVTKMVLSTQSVLNMYIETDSQKGELINRLNNEYREWETSSSVIGSQLKAYFHHTNLSSEWGSLKALTHPNNWSLYLAPTFSNNVTKFYILANSIDPPYTPRRIDSYNERQDLLEQMNTKIKHILESKISSFVSNPFQQIFK
jgi:ABC-type multidrug transport system fused ATPase/permease subunit